MPPRDNESNDLRNVVHSGVHTLRFRSQVKNTRIRASKDSNSQVISRPGRSIYRRDAEIAEKTTLPLPLRSPRLCGAVARFYPEISRVPSLRKNGNAFGLLPTRMRRRAARGLTLAAAIVSLMVVMLFASIVVRALGMRHHASRWNERQLQALFLAEAAVERAKVRLLTEPGFPGETWTVSLDDRGQTRTGVAEIRVLPIDGQMQQRRIEIEARWPDDPVHRVLRKKEMVITLPAAGAAS